MQESYLNSPIMYSIALTLIHFIWQGSLVALALKVALTFTPQQKPQLRYAFSALAMVLNLALPFITFFVLYKPTYLQLTNSLSTAPESATELGLLAIQNNEWYSNAIEYLPYLSLVWLTVICVLSLKLLIELYAVNKLTHQHTIPPEQELLHRFNSLIEQIGLKQTPQLLLSLNTQVPMAIGWLKPVVLIPFSMLSGLTPAQLDMLILHELAHIKRHDYIVNFVQTIVEIILFFHPAVLWVSNQMRNEREYCSDDIAVHHCGNPIAYARTLTETASICNKHKKRSIPGMAMAASGGDLTQRVLRLINEPHCSSQGNNGKWFASLSVLGLVFLVSSYQLMELGKVDINSNQYTFNNKLTTFEDEYHQQTIASNNNTTEIPPLADESMPSVQRITVDDSLNDNLKPELIETISNNSLFISENRPAAQQIENKQLIIQSATEEELVNTEVKSTTQLDSQVKGEVLKNTSFLAEESKSKSISDIAFEKTDSTLNTSVMSNTYADDIASLSTDIATTTPISDNALFSEKVIELESTQTSVNPDTPIVPEQKNAKLISAPAPKYPSTAKRKGIELEVKVDFVIDKNGSVRDIKFHPKNKVNYFRAAVRSAIEKWQFEPAKYNGKVIDSKMSKIFSFSLQR
jgi:TonB family protein